MRKNSPTACPHCDKRNDRHTLFDSPEGPPEPGDLSLCSSCHGIGIFTEDAVRKPTEEELVELSANQAVVDALFALMVAKESRL